jgi:uncharacterized membrane protein YeaQ/YmgE (transglycosylase-associated protein family)
LNLVLEDRAMCLVVVLLLIGAAFLLGLFATVGLVVWFIPWLIVGLIVGAIANAITASRHGILGDVLIGLAGSVVGGALLSIVFHHQPVGLFSLEGIIAAIIGAVILLLVGKVISRGV